MAPEKDRTFDDRTFDGQHQPDDAVSGSSASAARASVWDTADVRTPPGEPDLVSPVGFPTRPGDSDPFSGAQRAAPREGEADIFTSYNRRRARAPEDQDSDIFTVRGRVGPGDWTGGDHDSFPFALPGGEDHRSSSRGQDVFTFSLRRAAHAEEMSGFDPAPAGPTASAEAAGREAARHFERGLRSFRSGAYSDALEAWRQALSLDSENRAYASNVRKLEQMIEKKSDV